ncbi:HAD family hydrolase [Nocardia bovistercoris]|uniref:HAD-IA family hydrolase n=1 Tax=Nocardia bovistercoris TaxID=2785916 RepID=A0A931IFY6_9NOCA|nr:HAD family phosphatase [Nocardia bovistercoris]MBH0778968.1 HAD-IA family hydrolase [Nocardia bovistercoris]
MLLAGRLAIPEGIEAMLFDLDGVIIDSLALDYQVVEGMLRAELGKTTEVPHSVIRTHFALSLPDFWRAISDSRGLGISPDGIDRLVEGHEIRRREITMTIHEGVIDIMAAARAAGLRVAVVSNNPEAEIRTTLTNSSITVDLVVGNDVPGLRKKPAPDMYLEAARRLGLEPAKCVAIEDSLVGAQAAHDAGCVTIGVATGANSYRELAESGFLTHCYLDFAPSTVSLGRAGITNKTLLTPNEFASHMVEHIAWRLGCSIELRWRNDDWHWLGLALGAEIRGYSLHRPTARTIGMIDDGSAEVVVDTRRPGEVAIDGSSQVDLEWFLNSRVEQVTRGSELVGLLDGLAVGAGVNIDVRIASFEDPHHTWEGVFRGVGIALDRMVNERPAAPVKPKGAAVVAERAADSFERPVERGWVVRGASPWSAQVERRTAESVVAIDVEIDEPSVRYTVDVADTIDVTGIEELLREFAIGAGLRLDVLFEATRLNSSHVVTEDVGMALGRALKHMSIERMEEFGIQGAGSNVENLDEHSPIRVGISMEGRKFWKFVPMDETFADLRRRFLVGHTLPSGLFTEDLDDFIDGLSGGMEASVMVHVDRDIDPEKGWPLLFRGLGTAIAGLLSVNPHRRSLAPGVKATLA